MSSSPRIAVVGSLNTDLTTFTDVFPRAGETLFGKHFELGFGGKGANQAVAARLCGAEVMMVAKVGRDLFGEATIRNLASFGIDVSHVHLVDGVSTGVAPIFVEPNGQNRIIVIKGANDLLTADDVEAAAADLAQAQIIVLQFEIPLETIYHTVRFAKSRGIRCIVNPAPALPANISELSTADYFIPNETEAEITTGLPARTLAEAKACASTLLSHGFRRVVITLGARGLLLADATGIAAIAP
jgi:ribokinase